MLIGFPLLLIPLAICNIIVFLMPTLSLTAPLLTVPLMSGAAWSVTLSDMLIAFGIFLLWLEVMKARHPGAKYLTDHFLSLLVFGGAAAEFIMLPQFGSSTFFLLTLLALVDFLAGVSLRARRPRRVVATAPAPVVTPAPVAAPAPANVEPIIAEPSVKPTPAPAMPPVTEDAVMDHAHPVAPIEPSQEIIVPPRHDVVVAPEPTLPSQASPDLQPGSGPHRAPDVPPAR
ncbi:hypothetical protein BH11PSE4_BH11PSE4_15130 [soil metagenome]